MGRNGVGVAAAGAGVLGLWALLSGLTPSSPAADPGARARAVDEGAVQEGEALVRALGCGGCHRGVSAPGAARGSAPAFGPDGVPQDAAFVFDYLADPRPRRTGIAPARMPDFRLSERERLALALFLADVTSGAGEGDPVARARADHPDVDSGDGRRLFRALNCGACHAHPEVGAWSDGPDLSREGARVRPDWLRAYLAAPRAIRPAGHRPGLGSRMPDFRLTGSEVEAVSAYLLSLSAPGSAAGSLVGRAPTPFRARRTGRLVRDRLSCLGCHALGGDGGRLGPPLDGVGERLNPAFLREMIHRPRESVPGARMPTPLFAGEGLDRVVRWLLHREGRWSGADAVSPLELMEAGGGRMGAEDGSGAQAPPAGNLDARAPGTMAEADGAALYLRWCAHCHGPAGRGDGWNAPYLGVTPTPHAADSLMSARPGDTLYDGIHAGAWVLDGSPRMPAFGRTLSPGQIRALVGYIRSLCDCRGPAWSRDGGAGGRQPRGASP